jgi:tetratricopeptide (TPR) repeat protein
MTNSSRRRGRRLGVEIRAGSVKQARSEAGLSLGQVAQGDISRTAIYFVETGKAKPSMETLQLIATRTRKPIEFFIGEAGASDETALAEVERLVATGDNAGAVAAGKALVARSSDRRVVANARLMMSTALVRLGQGLRARSQASAAYAYFEEAGDVQMTAESLGWEAAAARVMDDPASVELATEALKRCRSLDPVPQMTEAKLLAMLGHVLVAQHEYTRAIEVYEEATAAGASFLDLRRLSYIYGNLSLAYQETGQFAHAGHYARKAMAIYETLRDPLQIAIAENNLAMLILRQGDLAAALRHAEAALRQSEQLAVETSKANILMTLCEIELALTEYELAAHYAQAAIQVADRLGEATNSGEAHHWLGRIAAAQGNDAKTDAEFAIAFQKFDESRAADWQARGHAVYAEILEARGNLPAANHQLRLALAAIGPRGSAQESARIAIA